jgi:hypothetical protein
MRVLCALLIVALAGSTAEMQGQTRRAPPARPRPAPPPTTPPQQEPAQLTCPAPLGTGVSTHQAYCDVLTGRDPAAGILIKLPPHKGDVTLTFDLHNRHTYSEEQMKDPRTAFARYSAGIGVLTVDNTLISRAAVENEFRKASDLIERIGGGAGPAGVKAVAPTGSESVRIVIPEAENEVSILGEKLTVDRADGSITYTAPGRPIAIVSNAMIEYRPAPPPKTPPAAKPPVKKPTP